MYVLDLEYSGIEIIVNETGSIHVFASTTTKAIEIIVNETNYSSNQRRVQNQIQLLGVSE